MNKLKRYTLNVLVGIDETVNAILGGDGSETISSRTGKAQAAGKLWGKLFAPVVNFIMRNPNHCKEAILPYIGSKAVLPDAIPPKEFTGGRVE